LYYNGGDGNDIVLVYAPTPVTPVYVDDDWTGFNNGVAIADADPVAPGNQPRVFGWNAFPTVTAGIAAVDPASPTNPVIVNPGNYAEAVNLNKAVTLTVNDSPTHTFTSLASIAGSTLALGANTLTFGDATSTQLDGFITGSGTMSKQGAGTLTV